MAAGRPGLRKIALGLKHDDSVPTTLNYQAIGKVLGGKHLPNPRQLTSLASWLHREGNIEEPDEESTRSLIQHLVELCEAAHNHQAAPESPKADQPSEKRKPAASDPEVIEYDLTSERLLLGCMLLSKDAVADVTEILNSEDFASSTHGSIFSTLANSYINGREVSVEEVAKLVSSEEFSKSTAAKYIATLVQEVDNPKNAEIYAAEIADRSLARRLARFGSKLQKTAQSAADDPEIKIDGLMSSAEEEFFSLTGERNSVSGLRAVLEGALDQVEAAGSRNAPLGVPTGFRDLDALNSGFRAGEFVLVGSTSGMGKSTLATDFIRSCSIQHADTSFLVSLQMNREDMITRMLSAEARVALHHMRAGIMTEEDWTRLARVMPSVNAAPIHIVDDSSYSLDQLARDCKRLKVRDNLRLVVVDSLDLLLPDSSVNRESGNGNSAEIAGRLRELAKKLELSIVAFYPMTRPPAHSTHRRPEIRDLPGSLENIADVVIILDREDAYERDSPRAGEADLIIAKNRNNPTAWITVAFQGHYARFVDMS
ncbi:replicative DNA helicase [Streptomyces xylophagus]|uniref:replicative DNA helicase n=1 Tax=Streptomyces xylophagus TaxID=285514 RepID=UPI00131DA68B|nr:DnaB-like helicase C-terminal domain-containing protein [Streptomyces xylophagus]